MIFICNILLVVPFSFVDLLHVFFCISFWKAYFCCLSISFNFLHIFRNSSWYNLLLSSFLFFRIVLLIVWYQFEKFPSWLIKAREIIQFSFVCVCVCVYHGALKCWFHFFYVSINFYSFNKLQFLFWKVFNFLFKIIKIVYVTERHWDAFAWSWWL